MCIQFSVRELIEAIKSMKWSNEKYNDAFAEGIEATKNANYEEAFAYFLVAAKAGNPKAQCRVGLCYSKGIGVQQDKDKAAYWYKKSASHGIPRAMVALENL